MRLIYHLVPKSTWKEFGFAPYRAASLESEGFIHCSNRDQVAWAANRFYANESELLALSLDVARLTSPVHDEDPGCGQHFPHIYGPINPEAVVQVEELQRGADGRWTIP
jgi:uncharacterized protein (DUF952 family)